MEKFFLKIKKEKTVNAQIKEFFKNKSNVYFAKKLKVSKNLEIIIFKIINKLCNVKILEPLP